MVNSEFEKRVYSFEELPELAKKSVLVYPYLIEEDYGRVKFKMYFLSMKEAIKRCMSYDELKETYSSFEEYHKEYFKVGDVPEHTEQYPVFHDSNDDYEWLTDGWHRFHSYYHYGFSHIPVIEIF